MHHYGCRAAIQRNNRLETALGRSPNPVTEASHYLGFYDLRCGAVEAVVSLCYQLSITWAREGDEDAHFHVVLNEFQTSMTRKEKQRERSVVRVLLADLLTGPKLHTCERDKGVKEELERLQKQLPELQEQ